MGQPAGAAPAGTHSMDGGYITMTGKHADLAADTGIRVGFTGSRYGMTSLQMLFFEYALWNHLRPVAELHHGDCIGADAQAHRIARQHRIPVVIHPPGNPALRAWCSPAEEYRPPDEYLSRNRSIVDDTEVLLATPHSFCEEYLSSGTWATVRYARHTGRPVVLVMPDGRIVYDQPAISMAAA